MNNRFYKQHGLSLIEMMIAMVISLVLIAGVGTVYFSSKRNYQTRDQLSVMDENARVALDSLRKHLEHAGYATPAKLPIGSYFYVVGDPDPKAGSCGTVKPLSLSSLKSSATNDHDGNTDYGDSISVRFVGDATLFVDALNSDLPSGCFAGSTSLESSLVYNAFHVDDDDITKDSLGKYVPILYGVGTNGNQNKKPVVNGIENIQFMYGLDAGADGTVDQYVNATNVGAGNWQRVISIKVGMLVRSLEPVLDVNTPQAYTLLDVNLTRNDRYRREVYTTTIQLRNVVDG